jgi:glycosidase
MAFVGCAEPAAEGRSPPPEAWDWRDEIIYQIVVDRFANGDSANDGLEGIDVEPADLARHQGGDWAGVLGQLDYLQRLGVTTLWLSPIVDNVQRNGDQDGYHGYWARDFTSVNARFGSERELVELVEAAHARGMRIILDVVINHAGNVFFYDLDGDGQRTADESEPPFSQLGYESSVVFDHEPVRLWRSTEKGKVERVELTESFFHLQGSTNEFTSATQLERGDFPTGLRDLATDDREVMAALIDTYAEWVRRTNVDGFRLDAVPHVPREDWARFCKGLRKQLAAQDKREFMLLGEVFRSEPADLASYTQPDMLDNVFDFTFKVNAVDHFLFEGTSAQVARQAFEGARSAYPSQGQPLGIGLEPWQARVLFMDNHDVARVAGRLDDPRVVWLGLVLMFTADGIPAIYYGTELGFSGGAGHASREVMWKVKRDETHPTFELISRLAELRQRYRVLRRGDLLVRFASQEDGFSTAKDAGLLAFERVLDAERVLTVVNGHANQESEAEIQTGFGANAELFDLLGNDDALPAVDDDGRIALRLAPRSALILTTLK